MLIFFRYLSALALDLEVINSLNWALGARREILLSIVSDW